MWAKLKKLLISDFRWHLTLSAGCLVALNIASIISGAEWTLHAAACAFCIGVLLELQRISARSESMHGTAATVEEMHARLKEQSGVFVLPEDGNAIAERRIIEIEPDSVNALLNSMLKGEQSEWYFRGGSGKWQVEVVLPELAAKKSSHEIKYYGQVLDPFNEEVCRAYVQQRNGSTRVKISVKDLRNSIFVYLASAAMCASESKVRPKISLRSEYSAVRVDGNSERMVFTVGDREANALSVGKGNWYRGYIKEEFVSDSVRTLSLPELAPAQREVRENELDRFFSELFQGRWESGDDSILNVKEVCRELSRTAWKRGSKSGMAGVAL